MIVQVVDHYGVPVSGSAVSFAVSPKQSATLRSVPGEPACNPASSSSGTICNTDSYGNAWAEVIMGPSAAQPIITATVAGMQVVADY